MNLKLEENVVDSELHPAGAFSERKIKLSGKNIVKLMWDLKENGFAFQPEYCEKVIGYYSPQAASYCQAEYQKAVLPMKAEVRGIRVEHLEYHLVNNEFKVSIADFLHSRSLAPKGVIGGTCETTSGVHISVESRSYSPSLERAQKIIEMIARFYSSERDISVFKEAFEKLSIK